MQLFELASNFARLMHAKLPKRHGTDVANLKLTAPETPCHKQRRVEHTKDVVAMPLNRTVKSVAARRVRPANPSCRGGASSVLRLTQPVASRLPSTFELSDWMSHAASVLMPVTGPHFDISAQANHTVGAR
jgi:hypothetical protein